MTQQNKFLKIAIRTSTAAVDPPHLKKEVAD